MVSFSMIQYFCQFCVFYKIDNFNIYIDKSSTVLGKKIYTIRILTS
jgi:hypothetical protein